MSPLNTTNPIALQVLMSETIFRIDYPNENVESSVVSSVVESLDPAIDLRDISIQYLGSNDKNILFIVENSQFDFFSKDAESAFLKTLKALKLNLSDVSVMNYRLAEKNVTFEQIKKQFNPKACIFLGFDPSRFGIQNCVENILTTVNDIQLLHSFSFEEMLNDTSKKRTFWEAIKLMKF